MDALHKTRFRLPNKQLWFGRARMYEDRIELTGWTWKGRYCRTIPLERVQRAEWWTQSEDTNFALYLDDGSSVALHLKQAAGTWKFEVDSLLGQTSLEEASLPGESPPKDAAA